MLPATWERPHHDVMTRLPRAAALQVGEFAVGVAAAYAAVGAVWALTQAVWPVLMVAAALVALAVGAELRWGPKATGLVAGLMPTALLAAGVFASFSLVLYRLH
jgi:hypothetical protein